jgi:hypothetical protein
MSLQVFGLGVGRAVVVGDKYLTIRQRNGLRSGEELPGCDFEVYGAAWRDGRNPLPTTSPVCKMISITGRIAIVTVLWRVGLGDLVDLKGLASFWFWKSLEHDRRCVRVTFNSLPIINGFPKGEKIGTTQFA